MQLIPIKIFVSYNTKYSLATYTDDTYEILSPGKDLIESADFLQKHLKIYEWSFKLKIKINSDKSILGPFTLIKFEPLPLQLH